VTPTYRLQIGGISDEHVQQDVADAMSANFDAFALNLLSDDMNGYAGPTVESLFSAAESAGFKLFFSFDLANLNNPDTFMPWLTKYASSSAYYTVDGKPFLSTFSGGTETFGQATPNDGWTNIFSEYNVNPYFVPNFDNAADYPGGFFNDFPVVNGAFGWESAWPTVDQGKANVSDTVDVEMISEAHTANKVYMMRKWNLMVGMDLS
jgi:glucan endo-1,3-alpha-glucosidase